ncbi:hypothetical protein ACLKA6_004745 [Drosophila palustris]
MEPITKIEVKSDDDEPAERKQQDKDKDKAKDKRSQKTSNQSSKRKSSELTTSKVAPREQSHQQTNGNNQNEAPAPKKKIKLKRNYRNPTKSPEKEPQINEIPAKSKPEINQESQKSRSASPDVIPIQAEPETLLISDSTDDEGTQVPEKSKESAVVDVQSIAPPAPEPAEESEPEEGEVREESENEAESQTEQQKSPENETDSTTVANAETEAPVEAVPTGETFKESEKPSTSKESNEAIAEPEQLQPNIPVVDDEDQNDDVISIGGDLEHEMIEELSKETDELAVVVKNEKPAEPDEEDNDVISLNTSDDEHEKLEETSSESWRTRYLKSSKVNQVLAASRLGKRVRDKIKESKRAQKKHNEGKADVAEKATQQQQQQTFNSKHEDGSMEQYQELLQHRQRKSSNGSKGDK